jgi:hypothetical protein
MKTLIATLALAALFIQPALADWVIVQKSTTDGQTQEITIKLKGANGEKARMDVASQMSILMDGSGGGEVVLLMHDQKKVMKMSAQMLKSSMEMAAKMVGGLDKGPPAKPQPTGQTEKVGEYTAEIYTWNGAIGNGKAWVVKDFPQAKELNDIQDKLMKAMGNPMSALTPAASDFPGMVMKSEMTMMGKTVTSETISAKQEPVADDIFAIPAGYEEMKMPAIPGLPGN